MDQLCQDFEWALAISSGHPQPIRDWILTSLQNLQLAEMLTLTVTGLVPYLILSNQLHA